MALPILDGNQTSVTLATTVSGGAHYPNHIIASSVTISSLPTIAGTVTVGNSVTISSLPAISGTVTANIGSALPSGTNRIGVVTIGGGTVTIGARTAQIGSVTASLAGWELLGSRDFFANGSSWIFNGSTISLYSSLGIIFGDGSSGSIQATFVSGQDNDIYWSDLNGAVARTRIISSGTGLLTTQAIPADLSISIFVSPSQSQTASLYGKKENVLPLTNTQLRGSAVTVSGTVTANNPNGTLTTRFGSVTTANLTQISTAVTNTSRKYLLAQNISAGTVTIGIGFSPTTTQGIQLTAGAGLTFDSFVPTGAVWWLGATTGATWTILEG